MAINILSGNLNVYGNAGNFETDPSTWGFGSSTNWLISRNSDYQTKGIHSLEARVHGPGFNFDGVVNTQVIARFEVAVGKKYLIKVNLFTYTSDPIADDDVVVRLGTTAAGLVSITYTQQSTVDGIKSAPGSNSFHQLETRVEGNTTGFINIYIQMVADGLRDAIGGGLLYADEFEIFEYEEVEDPEPECDLAINVGGSVVVNETALAEGDGSIDVAITGGEAPFEYSKDGGETWQSSNQFTGLSQGVYDVRVREQANPDCNDQHFFHVENDGAGFDFTTSVTHETISGANNGQISVTVTGDQAPFEYSKNGGDTWQLSNVFNSLAPGTYQIAVRDALGFVITKSVTVNAGIIIFDKVFWSRNPIHYQRTAPGGWGALENFRIYNEVRIASDVLMRMSLPPEADGKVNFQVRQAFRNALQAIPPASVSSVITKLTDRIKFFTHNTGNIQEDEVAPESTTQSNPNLVLLGGIDKFRWPSINYFSQYLPNNKKFLTWAPLEKYVTRNQEDYLNFWVYNLSFTSLKLQIKAYYDDATDQTVITKSISGIAYGDLYRIPAGAVNAGAVSINEEKNLVKYELTLLNQSDAAISETRTYVIEEAHPRERFFMFLNSLGSEEVLRFTGQTEREARITGDQIQKHLPYNYAAADGEMQSAMKTITDSSSISTGYFKGTFAKYWQEYMKEFMLSRQVYELIGTQRKPVMVMPGTLQYFISQDYEHYARFEIMDVYQDENFTPSNI